MSARSYTLVRPAACDGACAPTDEMAHVLALMNRMKLRALPVVGERGELLGTLKVRGAPPSAWLDGEGSQMEPSARLHGPAGG